MRHPQALVGLPCWGLVASHYGRQVHWEEFERGTHVSRGRRPRASPEALQRVIDRTNEYYELTDEAFDRIAAKEGVHPLDPDLVPLLHGAGWRYCPGHLARIYEPEPPPRNVWTLPRWPEV